MLVLVTLSLCLLLCALASAQPMAPARIFVSPAGDDAGPGSADHPLASLPAAQRAVRALIAQGLRAPVEVLIRPGLYTLAEPLVFTPEDSGAPGCPITWRAFRSTGVPPVGVEAPGAGDVVISGGRRITGWQRCSDDLWSADVPADLDFRLLRVGDAWATRARHPNFDAADPYAGGWTFATWGGEPWEKGAWGVGVANVHNVGDRLTWNVRVPADATYRVWLRYGHHMKSYNRERMDDVFALSVDDGERVLMKDLPDTGSWAPSRWCHTCDLSLTAGDHLLQWQNLKGGGINMDAFILTDDEAWDAAAAFGQPTWWGAVDIKPVAPDKHMLTIQVEACDTHEGPEIQVPSTTPPGTTTYMGFADGALPYIANAAGSEVHIFIAWGWVNAIVPVASIDAAGRRILFAEGGAAQDVRIGNRFFLENARELLDAPGEWFLDRGTGVPAVGDVARLLYIPSSPDFPNQPTVAPVLDRLLVLEGDPATGRFVEHLRFEGLRFADTTYTLTRDYYSPQDAAVVMSGARDCTIKACEFSWLGGYAVKLTNLSERCVIRECDIHHMGQGGVILVGGTKVQPHHCEVLGNTMQHLGLIYKHVAGVYGIHGSDNRVAHNRIWDVPRYAISFKSQGEDRLSHRNVIEFNDLRRANLETNDTGMIETLGYEHRDSGNIIRYNLMLDSVGMGTTPEGSILSPHFTWGVYLDDYSSGTTVFGNIIARNVVGGGCIHGGQNNVFQNNIMVEARDHQFRCQPRDEFMKGNKFINNIVVYSRPEAQVIFSWRDKRDMFSECDRNLYWLKTGDLRELKGNLFPAGSWTQWQEAGFDKASIIADPLFVDPDSDDYRLRPDSPAWALGFQEIPVDRIGPAGLEPE